MGVPLKPYDSERFLTCSPLSAGYLKRLSISLQV
jgi:hypothetical protein